MSELIFKRWSSLFVVAFNIIPIGFLFSKKGKRGRFEVIRNVIQRILIMFACFCLLIQSLGHLFGGRRVRAGFICTRKERRKIGHDFGPFWSV